MTPILAEPTDLEISIDEFRAKILGLLNSTWPRRSQTDADTIKAAWALAAQLRNWESWK